MSFVQTMHIQPKLSLPFGRFAQKLAWHKKKPADGSTPYFLRFACVFPSPFSSRARAYNIYERIFARSRRKNASLKKFAVIFKKCLDKAA
ncbi:MAG: hypothetical protein IJW22_04690 [Clostridia bacterium]|nr:hypothetical protein [Clostridia bacterium]